MKDAVSAQQQQIKQQSELVDQLRSQLQQLLDATQQANVAAQKAASGVDQAQTLPSKRSNRLLRRKAWLAGFHQRRAGPDCPSRRGYEDPGRRQTVERAGSLGRTFPVQRRRASSWRILLPAGNSGRQPGARSRALRSGWPTERRLHSWICLGHGRARQPNLY